MELLRDPAVSGYNLVTADLAPFAGRTVRLRIASAVNVFFFSFGVDAVSVNATLSAVPTLSEGTLIALALLTSALGMVALRRRAVPRYARSSPAAKGPPRAALFHDVGKIAGDNPKLASIAEQHDGRADKRTAARAHAGVEPREGD